MARIARVRLWLFTVSNLTRSSTPRYMVLAIGHVLVRYNRIKKNGKSNAWTSKLG